MPSPARRGINNYLEEKSKIHQGKTLFVGVNYQWEKHYRNFFPDMVTMDIRKNVIEPDVYGSITNCPEIKDDTYDVIIMVGIWELLEDERGEEKATWEIWRILKPGGILIFGFPGLGFHLNVHKYTLEAFMKIIESDFSILEVRPIYHKHAEPTYILGVAKK